jgi:hypothetical protein
MHKKMIDRFNRALHEAVNLPLFDVPLNRFIMRPSIAVPTTSVAQIELG